MAAVYPAPPVIHVGFPSLGFTPMGLSLKGQRCTTEHPHPELPYGVLMCFIQIPHSAQARRIFIHLAGY